MYVARVSIACVLVLGACTSGGQSTNAPTVTPTAPATSAPLASDSSSVDVAPRTADWPTYHGSADRGGVAKDMPAVRGKPRIVASLKLDAAVYASPIVAHGVTVAATENNSVYAFDAQFHQLWKRHLGPPSPATERPCGNIDPLGITGTPVYDSDTGSIFVAPELGGPPRHRLVALSAATGAVRWNRGIDLPGVETEAMQERGALALSGGRVWVPFGGLAGDCGGYKGRLIGVALSGAGDPVSYTVPTTREAGIWTPPGPSVDARGDLFVAVGNGESGRGDPYDHSDSVLQIGTNGRLRDFYSPTSWPTDNENDLDLGSQGPALVGAKWVFTAGKSGFGYVLRRGNLGGIGGEVSKAQICHSYGGTAVDADVVYVPCEDGVRAVRIDGAGTMHVLWHAAPPGSPVVGGGRIWALDPGDGVLHALDPKTGRTLEQIAVGETSRFATPALHGSDVIVPTLTGIVVVRTS